MSHGGWAGLLCVLRAALVQDVVTNNGGARVLRRGRYGLWFWVGEVERVFVAVSACVSGGVCHWVLTTPTGEGREPLARVDCKGALDARVYLCVVVSGV